MKLDARRKAVGLRKRGYSMKEIAEHLRVSKSSVSLWVRSVPLSRRAQRRLRSVYTAGQIASQKAHRKMTERKIADARTHAQQVVSALSDDARAEQVLCAMLYWCEGAKMHDNRGYFSFVNSDPMLVRTFLVLLRRSFSLDESKFRVCVHMHSYHNEDRQLVFWSETTGIPLKQFIRSHKKAESGQSIRSGYQGCVQVRYYDTKLLRYILALAQVYMGRAQGL